MNSKSIGTRKSKARAQTTSLEHESPAQQVQTALYIADMCGELAIMANRMGIGLTGHFLAMAKAEAERIADRAP